MARDMNLLSKVLNIVEATPEIKDQRRAICKTCPDMQPGAFRGAGACGLCGCYLPGKTAWVSSKCPAKPPKW